MTIDYQSHPSELAKAGDISSTVKVQALRDAIPTHCWKPLYRWAIWYIFRDVTMVVTVMMAASTYIPLIENTFSRYCAWWFYGYVEGLLMTGIWVLGHECGHSAFSPSEVLNHSTGFIFHSALLTPYFSWQSTHRRHHIYANNLAKDHNYVPPRYSDYAASLRSKLERLEDFTEDSPIHTLLRILLQQIMGWPWYLLNNITASQGSLAKGPSGKFLGNSHLLPSSSLFRPEEARLILLSDVGIGLTVLALFYTSQIVGWPMVALLYLQPYMWVNHWIVAITYLHHTHPKVPKFEDEAWSFLKGATATVDRDFGWVGKYILHNVIEYHVIHHLFPRIPFYYGEEATNAILPLLGKHYHSDKNRSFLPALWESFTQCQWVEPDDESAKPENRTMWFKGGPSPPPALGMR
ncbi:hypothetical protein MMC30_004020 [Trapelia coarctata]|nr:hypothetical protein [Trapelia coarctata]